ncbi:MAG: GntR family transcriptional regulator [Acidimicrobiia bacterium]|nr:GntR family transcriptional regulator [Acidimicrobiia bacterium]
MASALPDGDESSLTNSLQMAATVTAEEAVTNSLRRAIREGVLVPGQRLTQSELAGQLGVSRIPLRDALRRLEVESLVHIDGHKGARVTVLTPQDVAEIYEMRILLEARCMTYAVDNLTEQAAEELSKAAVGSEDDSLSPGEAFNRRRSFYGDLYHHANRPRMRRTIMQLRDNVDRYHLLSDRAHAHHAHQELADAISQRDGAKAATVLVDHIVEARDDLIAELGGTE